MQDHEEIDFFSEILGDIDKSRLKSAETSENVTQISHNDMLISSFLVSQSLFNLLANKGIISIEELQEMIDFVSKELKHKGGN